MTGPPAGGGPPAALWPYPAPAGVDVTDRSAWYDAVVMGHLEEEMEGMDPPPFLPYEFDVDDPGDGTPGSVAYIAPRPTRRFIPYPADVEHPAYYQMSLNRINAILRSGLMPMEIVNNGLYKRCKAGLLAKQQGHIRSTITTIGIMVALGPNGVISPSAGSIRSMLAGTRAETRDMGVVARAFVAIVCDQMDTRGVTYKEVVDLSVGRAISRHKTQLKEEGIWGPGFLLANPRPQNTKGMILEFFLVFDSLLSNNVFREGLELTNRARVRLSNAEMSRLFFNPAFHAMVATGHAGFGGHAY